MHSAVPTWKRRRVLALVAALCAVGLLWSVWVVRHTDRRMRAALLREASVVSGALDLEAVSTLTSSLSDRETGAFQRLKSQLLRVKEANPAYRYVYLLGKDASRGVFFYLDAQQADDLDDPPAAPGEAYPEASGDLIRVFATGEPVVEGPVSDRWGTWVSALVPLALPTPTGAPMVLGIDVDATDWSWQVAAGAVLPVGALLCLLLGLLAAVVGYGLAGAGESRPVRHRLLPPLTAVLLLLVAAFGAALFHLGREGQRKEIRETIDKVGLDIRAGLRREARTMAAISDVLKSGSAFMDRFQALDRDAVLDRCAPLWGSLGGGDSISSITFYLADGASWLEVHDPGHTGPPLDDILREELLRTGQPVQRLTRDDTGRIVLRVVDTARRGEALLGFMELRKPMTALFEEVAHEHGSELAVLGEDGPDGPPASGGVRGFRLAHSTLPVDSEVLRGAMRCLGDHGHGKLTRHALGGRNWWIHELPLRPGAGEKFCTVLVMKDAMEAEAALGRYVIVFVGAAVVLLMGLLGFVYVLLLWTDRGIARQHAEVRESRDRLDQLAAHTRSVAWEVDAQGRFTYLSHVCRDVLGYAPEELVGTGHFYDLHPQEGREAFKAGALAVFERKEPFAGLENPVVTKDGRVLWVSTNGLPMLDGEGRLLGYRGVDLDITERRLAEAERERLMMAIEQATETVIVTDAEGTIQYVNPAFQVSSGYTREEAVGRNPRLLKSGMHDDAYYREMYDTLLDNRTWSGMVINRNKAGVLFVVEMTITPVHDAAGMTVNYVAVSHDVTARRLAEEELRRMNESLEEQTALANSLAAQAELANAAKSEFLANMSHEIRTPMNGVIGMTGLLLDTNLDEEQRRYAEAVRVSGETLLALINDILDFSKIEAGKLDLESIDFDLVDLVDDLGATLALRAHEKGLELVCACAPGTPALLQGDPGRLRQVLTNLVGNAIKFTHQGEVVVRAEVEEEGEEGVLLRFSVSDTGIGIPADRQDDLFQSFTQVDASTTRKYGGTGLGLAISKQLAELMGGAIGVESAPDEGSCFWFTARLQRQPGAKADRRACGSVAGTRVLVVDDNGTNREVLAAQLAAWDAVVTVVSTGEEALGCLLEAARAGNPFPAALIDMQMPGMDGEALGRRIQAEALLADTRLIMLTSLGRRGDVRRLTDAGFSAYLTKPVRQADLCDALSAVLAGKPGTNRQPMVTRHNLRVLRRNRARVLLAEDNVTNQQVAMAMLRKLGVQCEAVANGVEAVEALCRVPYDLVFMDVQMPEMSGLEATQRVRDPQSGVLNPAIPIVAMTARAMEGDREECLAAGMDDYLTKPVNHNAIVDMLHRWLPGDAFETAGQDAAAPADTPTSGDPRNGPPVFDEAGFLRRLMDDRELALHLVSTFLEEAPRLLRNLEDAVNGADSALLERHAHSIKGTAASMGGEVLRGLAGHMENAARAGRLAEAVGLHAPIRDAVARLEEALRSFRDGAAG